MCVRSFKNILPNFSTQFRLKFIYNEAINVANITRMEWNGENYIIGSLVICTPYRILCRW